jgi:hypothetical protein
MQVKVGDTLPRSPSAVHSQVKSFWIMTLDQIFPGFEHQITQSVSLFQADLKEIPEMTLGNDKQMPFGDRELILNQHKVLILNDDLSFRQLAKDAIHTHKLMIITVLAKNFITGLLLAPSSTLPSSSRFKYASHTHVTRMSLHGCHMGVSWVSSQIGLRSKKLEAIQARL